MRARWRRSTQPDSADIDVTAFLSLMVILVPFLLLTAVFTRITVLEVQPPPGQIEPASSPDSLQLQVIVRKAGIEVHYRGQTKPERIEWSDDTGTLRALAELAGDLKARHPESLAATVLVEPQIPYDRLVQVLDVLRVEPGRNGNGVPRADRFPLISLGPVPSEWRQGAR